MRKVTCQAFGRRRREANFEGATVVAFVATGVLDVTRGGRAGVRAQKK